MGKKFASVVFDRRNQVEKLGYGKVDVCVYLRNKCAHGNVLYDAIIPKGIKSGPAGKVTNDNYESLGAAINVLKYFIGIISSNRKRDLENELNAVLDRMDKRNPKLLKLILKTSNISYSSKK